MDLPGETQIVYEYVVHRPMVMVPDNGGPDYGYTPDPNPLRLATRAIYTEANEKLRLRGNLVINAEYLTQDGRKADKESPRLYAGIAEFCSPRVGSAFS